MWRPRNLRGVWKNAPDRLLEQLLDPPTFYQVFCEYEGEPLVLDGWQVAFLRRKQRFRALEKSVQIGYSFVCAMESLHLAMFYEDETSAFVSVNEADAKEKVLYATKLYHSIPDELRRFVPLVVESKEELYFGDRHRPSRILTKPATSGLRGLAGHIYLDEVDHYRPGQDKEVFTAAMGRVTRQKRRLTVGSSVFGEDTVLSNIMDKQAGRYPDFLKFVVPWWAREDESDRLDILKQRNNMPAEDFAQEYECRRGDSTNSAFPQDLIRRSWHDEGETAFDRLDPSGTFIAGFDPGGSRHPAVLTVCRLQGDEYRQVGQVVIRNEALATQEARLDELLGTLPGLRVAIDRMGIGQHMSESLERRWSRNRVVLVTFSKQTKNQMVLDLKKNLEDGRLTILRDKELAYQLNRTRRYPGGEIEQAGSDKKTHYDKFWALAMASNLVSGIGSVYELRGLRSLTSDEPVGAGAGMFGFGG